MVKEVVRGISKQGRSKTYHRRGLWAIKKKNGGKFPQHEKKAKNEPAVQKPPKFYPADDTPHPKTRRKVVAAAKLRASITPGTILIILAGRFKGKRVVFLRQLPSGLLLVTGPFAVNGVPLRRVNQAYVIATSTKTDISKVDASKFDDAYFVPAEKKRQKKKGEEEFFEGDKEKKSLPSEYIENQKTVDSALTAGLSEDLKGYLSTRFSLKSNDRPHLLKF
ncbi:hypothetical protein WJX74_000827 [Apatococcus lobatus]|uniref:60S ribosomal protein L6 n=1 Tax=Apatococcus lobatus TaxID=904363 RepID=A0AAW1RS25_9CHLO